MRKLVNLQFQHIIINRYYLDNIIKECCYLHESLKDIDIAELSIVTLIHFLKAKVLLKKDHLSL